jgi:hypothetical protein
MSRPIYREINILFFTGVISQKKDMPPAHKTKCKLGPPSYLEAQHYRHHPLSLLSNLFEGYKLKFEQFVVTLAMILVS